MLWRLHSFSKPVVLGYFSSRYDLIELFLLFFEPMFDGRAPSRYSSPSVACTTVFIINSSPKFTPFSLGGRYQIMFGFFPRRISFVRQCLIREYSSPTTRDGSTSSNDASRKPVSPRMQVKPTKITWKIRELSFSPHTTLFLIHFILL
jgi:hypothetical protein